MPTRTRTTSASALAAAALLVLTGCQSTSPSEKHLAILAEAPIEPVPEHVNSAVMVEPGSARFLAEVDGIEFYVGQERASPVNVCLVPVSAEDPENNLSASCGGVSEGIILSTTRHDIDVEATLVADEVADADLERLAQEGWAEESPNLWIRTLPDLQR